MKNPIQKYAIYRDAKDDSVEYEFHICDTVDETSTPCVVRLPGDVATDVNKLRNKLTAVGAKLPLAKADCTALLAKLIASPPKHAYRFESKAGWLKNGRTYVRPVGALGTDEDKIQGVNTRSHVSGVKVRPSVRGDVISWKASVGTLGGQSSVAMLAVSAAFAAPLLKCLNREPFVLSFFANRKEGKTALSLAAASVTGITASSELQRWDKTPMALDQTLALHNDGLLVIDDLSSLADNKKKEYQTLKKLAYKIAGGSGKSRSTAFTKQHGISNDSWRCLVLTSRERPIRDLAAELNEAGNEGDAVRLIDVPTLLPPTRMIFDRPNVATNSRKNLHVREFYPACKNNSGKVFEAYIRFLIKDRKRIRNIARMHMSDFLDAVKIDGASEPVRHLADNFAIIYAGGAMATERGLTGWKKQNLLDAVKTVFRMVRREFPSGRKTTLLAVRILARNLKALPGKSSLASDDYQKVAGYKIRSSQGVRYIIRHEAFMQYFASSEMGKRIVDLLTECKLFTTAKSKAGGRTRPKMQKTWPDKSRVRCYEIKVPKGRSLYDVLKTRVPQ